MPMVYWVDLSDRMVSHVMINSYRREVKHDVMTNIWDVLHLMIQNNMQQLKSSHDDNYV